MGYEKIVFKSDQKSPIVALKDAVWRELGNEVTMERVEEGKDKEEGGGRTEEKPDMVMEESPVGESESNGMVERAIQEVQGQIRTMRAAWESRYGRRMTGTDQVLPWMVSMQVTYIRDSQWAPTERHCTGG